MRQRPAAARDGVRAFALSWKDSQTPVAVGRALESLPDEVDVWGYFHEREDDIRDGSLSLATWWCARSRRLR